MVCAPVRWIIPSLKLGDYLSVQAHNPCSISHLECLIGTESELLCHATTFADYFGLVSYMYISSDANFSEIYQDWLVTALKSLIDVLCCRVTALDK